MRDGEKSKNLDEKPERKKGRYVCMSVFGCLLACLLVWVWNEERRRKKEKEKEMENRRGRERFICYGWSGVVPDAVEWNRNRNEMK